MYIILKFSRTHGEWLAFKGTDDYEKAVAEFEFLKVENKDTSIDYRLEVIEKII